MKCPKCQHDLAKTREERIQTMSEHISNPNGTPSLKSLYQCVNSDCQCFRAFGWDSEGDFYALKYYHKVNDVFPDERYAAIGSFAKKMEVEVYGKGLPEKKYLHPALMLWFFQPYIEWHGISDENGNILKKWFTVGILKKDKSFKNQYCIQAKFCWHTWAFLWKMFKRQYNRKDYKKAFEPSLNRAWVYRWFETFVHLRYFYNVPK